MNAPAKLSKGKRTAQRLLDVAEQLFAERGFGGTTLRDVAEAAGIREPGIYNHFANKEVLYCAVLERGLQPMADVMDALLAGSSSMQDIAGLPVMMTDLLAAHPAMPALFQQALGQQSSDLAQALMDAWLDRLLSRGQRVIESSVGEQADKRATVIQMVAMFNLCTGYFLSQRLLDRYQLGDVTASENLQQQKKLLSRIVKMFLIG